MAALDLVSAIYSIVMIVGSFQGPKEALDKTRSFRLCLVTCFIGCLWEAVSNIVYGDANRNLLLIISTFIIIILLDIVVFFYTFYLRALLEDKGIKYHKFTILLSAMSVVSLILNTVMFVTGHMFTFSDGEMIPGFFFPYRILISSLIFVGIFVIFVMSREAFGFKNIWLTVLFMSLPAFTIVSVYIFANQMRNSLFAATTTSLFVVYVFIQSKIIIQTDVNSQILGRLSFYDTLTGLKNRRGYENIVNELSEEEKVSVVFSDANGLKAVNDSLGHASGDDYIKKIAGMVSNAFPDGETCRISGDEFVCIIRNTDEEAFGRQIRAFKETINKEGRIVAFGYETGFGKQFSEVVKAAEK